MEKMIELASQWEIFKKENPKVRIRDAAKLLETTEAELIATQVGSAVIRLKDDYQGLLKGVEALGKVMALTRNDYCVHERKGVYSNVSFSGPMGLLVNPDIDLRLFMSQWGSAFAVDEGGRKSLQFFGKNGEAVHKIYLTEDSSEVAYEELVIRFTADEQVKELLISSAAAAVIERLDEEVDVAAFQSRWLGLKDTHEFHGLLREFGVSRTQGLRLAPEGFVRPVSKEALKKVLHRASETDLEIMVFTGSKGCIQIHTGLVKKLLQTGPWFNVLDPDFNMHLREDAIDGVFVVRKPTEDGVVTSVEVFDNKGEIIVQFFGKRKPGVPENEGWREILAEV